MLSLFANNLTSLGSDHYFSIRNGNNYFLITVNLIDLQAAIFPGMLRRQSTTTDDAVASKIEDDVFSVDKNDNKASKSDILEKCDAKTEHVDGDIASKVESDFVTPAKSRGSVVSAHDISATLYGTPEEMKHRPVHSDETFGGIKPIDATTLI